MNTGPLIIVGTGLAGYHLAKEFRKLDSTRELILVTIDAGHFYSKPQLSIAISQNKTPEQLIITAAEKMQQQLNATLYSFSKVLAIKPSEQAIVVQTPTNTLDIHYGQLVLALGANPKPFPLLDNNPQHFRVNQWQDYQHFRTQLSLTDPLTIIGSGLVGCEFAHDFSHHHSDITLMTPDPYPLFGLVPEKIGSSLQEALEQKGIRCLTKQTTFVAIQALIAIGLQPNITLAKEAGLNTQRGIVVNDLLQTSSPNIYALGDCAEINGICRQYVAPILQSARMLAQTLCNQPSPVKFPAFPISLKVSAYPVISLPPQPGLAGEWQIESEGRSHKALFVDKNEQLQGYALSGKYIEERQACLTLFQTRRPMCTHN